VNVYGAAAILIASLSALVALAWRRSRVWAALVFASVSILCVVIDRKEARFISGFDKVAAGADDEFVASAMGRATKETDGTISVYGDSLPLNERTPGCTRQLWYHRFWVPEAFTICLSAEGVVLEKDHFGSW
jgi:hypothetical protein